MPISIGAALGVAGHIVLALTAVVALGRALGRACRAVGQPPVIGEIVAGIVLGPSCLGALTCAAVGDVVVWCLLAMLAGVVRGTGTGMLLIATLTAAFVTVMVVWVRPVAVRLAQDAGETPSRGLVAGTLLAAAVAAGVTTAIGIHAIFGAFLLGAVIPPDTGLARAVKRGFAGVLAATLLPAFFAYTGVRTEIGLITGAGGWLVCGAIICVATAGKLGGTALAGRGAGLSWPVALALGVLMNTRGLMEIIVLNVGLELGLITNTLFTMFVIVAVVTTVTTSPLLDLVLVSSPHQRRRPDRGREP